MAKVYTPLRYPGGKSALAEFVWHIIELNGFTEIPYCEPFAGGAGVAMNLLLQGKVKSVILNDLDTGIYSIWYAIFNDTEWLIEAINNTEITLAVREQQKKVYNELKNFDAYSHDLAFATFFLNRVNYSGILTGGPIGGKEQKGKYKLDCRFNKESLIDKIKEIAKYRDNVQLFHIDAVELLKNQSNIFVFADPPYWQAGDMLYEASVEHSKLAKVLCESKDIHWIATYDNNINVANVYEEYGAHSKLFELQYSALRKRKELECMFYKNVVIESFDKIKLRETEHISAIG